MAVVGVAAFQMAPRNEAAGANPEFKIEGVADEAVFDGQAGQ